MVLLELVSYLPTTFINVTRHILLSLIENSVKTTFVYYALPMNVVSYEWFQVDAENFMEGGEMCDPIMQVMSRMCALRQVYSEFTVSDLSVCRTKLSRVS